MNSSFFFLHSGLKQAPWYFSWPRQPPSAPCLPSPWGGVQQRETQPKFSARLKALEIRASCKELLCIWLALSPTLLWIPFQPRRLSGSSSQAETKPPPLRSDGARLAAARALSVLISHPAACLAPSGAVPRCHQPCPFSPASSRLPRLVGEGSEGQPTRLRAES